MRTIQNMLLETKSTSVEDLMIKFRFSFKTFARTCLGLEVQDFHEEWIKQIENNKQLNLIAATGHGKTEILGVAYPLWKIIFIKGYQILLTSNSSNQAVDILERQKDTILDNELLLDYVSEKRMKDSGYWTTSAYKLKNNARVMSKTMNKNVRGLHVDLIIADEIAQYDDHEIFHDDVMSRIRAKKGRVACISTPINDLDLTQSLKRNKEWVTLEYPAINEKGKILWEQKPGEKFGFTMKELMKIKRDNEQSFEKTYMLKMVTSGDAMISPTEIANALVRGVKYKIDHKPNGIKHHIGADFQISQSKYGQSYTVYMSTRREDNLIIIKDIERHKGLGLNTQQDRLRDFYKNNNGTKANIDSSNHGKAWLQDLRHHGIPVTGYDLHRQQRTDVLYQLEKIMQPDSPLKLVIPNHPKHNQTQKMIKILIKELKGMTITEDTHGKNYIKTTTTDDTIFALALSIQNQTKTNPQEQNIIGYTPQQIIATQLKQTTNPKPKINS